MNIKRGLDLSACGALSPREMDGLERYVICPIPHGEPVYEGWESDLPMTARNGKRSIAMARGLEALLTRGARA